MSKHAPPSALAPAQFQVAPLPRGRRDPPILHVPAPNDCSHHLRRKPKAGEGVPVRAGDAVTLRVVSCKAGRGLVTVEASLVDSLGSDHPAAKAAADEPNFGVGVLQSVPAARGTKRPGKRSREAAAAAAAAAVSAAAAGGPAADSSADSASASSSSAASNALAAEGVDSAGKRPRLSADADAGAAAAAASADPPVGKPAKKAKKSKKSKVGAA